MVKREAHREILYPDRRSWKDISGVGSRVSTDRRFSGTLAMTGLDTELPLLAIDDYATSNLANSQF